MAKAPKSPKLKVFRTAAGFHDAYVAAPSRAAALRAWGADRDLFARGVAEEVTDDALMADALAHPGEVIRRSRGTAAEQLAALPPDPPRAAASPRADEAPRAKARERAADRAPPPRRKAPPEPDRTAVNQAAAALAAAQGRFAREEAEMAAREEALARDRRDMERAHTRERARLEAARDRAAAALEAAMAAWRAAER
jgi:hypothetical protein